MTFNPDIHHRRSLRLRNYDYGWVGGYFVTICTDRREGLFGEVVDGTVRLTRFGEIVREEWVKSAEIRQEIGLDEFVIMPNHLHGVVVIDRCSRATQRVAPTDGPVTGSLGAMIGQFKSVVTKRINVMRNAPGCPVWQRNYYEHVVRGEKDLQATREYIVNNPLQWELDENNPARIINV